jgi:hypothetical protein
MQRENEVQHVFLVGAKSLGAYGGSVLKKLLAEGMSADEILAKLK